MSNNYDNWDRLVKVVLRREHDRQLALAVSRESSFNSISSWTSSSFRSEVDYDQNPQLEANTAPQVSSFLGIVGLEKAVNVLGKIGSSMTNLNSGGFTSGFSSKGNRISILAFEVANTIANGVNLVQSLSEENIQILRMEILHSEGIQQLVSTDMSELLQIAAADKREEFDVFSHDITRFGNLVVYAQFHNLDRFFSKYSNLALYERPRGAKRTIKELTSLAQHTFDLYRELHDLDKFEQDYQLKLEKMDSLHPSRKGKSLVMLQSELKHQRKLVQLKRKLVLSMKKKSLWSQQLNEVVERLVDVGILIHQDILESFGDNGLTSSGKTSANKPEKLGVAGLSLHYANIITQIDYIASHPTSFDPEMRDTLYNGLPSNVKDALRSRLRIIDTEEDLTIPQIKGEMEKTLQWLVPLATNTTKCICEVYVENIQHLSLAHHGFGRIGEWPNAGNELGKRVGIPNNLIRLQTLYHADKQKVDWYILELLAWLHRLVRLVRYNDNIGIHKLQLLSDDKNLLDNAVKRKNQNNKVWTLWRSTGSEHLKGNVLDILDGIDSTFFAPREDIR